MKLYEVIFNITEEGQHKSFLTVHIEEDVGEDVEDDDDGAIEKAVDYANDVLGIEPSRLELNSVDQIN